MVILAATSVLAQSGQQQEIVHGRPVIYGKLTPHLISDETALRSWLLSVAEPASADATRQKRISAKLASIGLDANDMAITVSETRNFHAGAAALDVQMKGHAASLHVGSGRQTMDEYLAAYRSLGDLANQTHRKLLARLSPAGRERIKQHLDYVKTRIRIIPGPRM